METTRRGTLGLIGAGAGLAAGLLPPSFARANPENVALAIREQFGDAVQPRPGRVAIDLPAVAETGNSVPLAVEVESPMTAEDHVVRIAVFAEGNPRANVLGVRLGRRAGLARFATNIRLQRSQDVIAVAEMSDGSCWFQRRSVIVTAGACLDVEPLD